MCSHGYRLLTCPDDEVRETACDTLKIVVQLQIRRVPDIEDIADYLNGSTEGAVFQTIPSLWSRVRMCTNVNNIKKEFTKFQ